jgi:glycosyltransferase involved in cell wall biosynthesis
VSAVPTRAAADRREPRVALVHDWLTGMRGGEKVLEAMCDLYPDAPLYSLVHARGKVSPTIERRRIRTSFVQRLPAATRLYRQFLPLFPCAVELFDLDGFDLVISTSHCAVKSIVRPGRAVHVSYCHSPMRYAWDQFGAYFGPAEVGAVRSRLLRPVMAALARWDRTTAGRVDSFVANSRYVADRIRRYYNRESTVVYPPVDTAFYRPSDDRRQTRSGFLVVSALVPYKRLDVAIDACRTLGVPLTIVGTGPEQARLQAMAGSDVRFLGWRSNEEIRELYRLSAATLLPGVEDFGMVPVEAQACGCPVVALGSGGAGETVVDGATGVLVFDPSIEAFADGLSLVRSLAFEETSLREHALHFSRERFVTGFQAAVSAAATARDDAAAAARRTQPTLPVTPEAEQ